MNKNNSYTIGKKGEELAKHYLKSNNWQIIEENYKVQYGEIDILAIKNNFLVAFEVKKRKDFKTIFYVISNKQKIRISNALEFFLSNNLNYSNYNIRIDAIFIHNNKITHIENAWQQDEL